MYDDHDQSRNYGRGWNDGSRRRSRSRPGHRRSRSRSYSPTRDAGSPSDTVILEGLPFGISTNELHESLSRGSIAAELPPINVRISSKGHRRAFVQFDCTKNAGVFINEHFPRLFVQLDHVTDDVPEGQFETYIHYARSREQNSRANLSGDWNCSNCDYLNFATRTICKNCGSLPSAGILQPLTPVTDAAETPSQLLLVYSLAPTVQEDILAMGMKRLEIEQVEQPKDASNTGAKLKSTAPNGDTRGYGARQNSLHRVFLMRDPQTDDTMRYGFAEFWTLEDATAALTKFRMSRNFTVGGYAVTVTPIHMGVFVPEDREYSSAIEYMSFNPLLNPAIRVRYRDPRAYPSQKVVSTAPPTAENTSEDKNDDKGDTKKTKKRKAEGNAEGSMKSTRMGGRVAIWQRKADELHGAGNDADRSYSAAQRSNTAPERSKVSTDVNAPIKFSLSSGIAARAAAPAPESDVDPILKNDADVLHTGQQMTTKQSGDNKSEPELYLDHRRLMCLICMRKFKEADEIVGHGKSRKHLASMADEKLVEAALPRLAARDKRQKKQVGESGVDTLAAAEQYRDRAKERREMHNQPAKPSAPPKNSDAGKGSESFKMDKVESSAALNSVSKPAAKPVSKGAGMLAKMGWTSGSGLGANNDGRTESIATDAYQEGVGLGAEGGKLGDAAAVAERNTTNNYKDYLNSVQDKARKRYNEMD